jgi:uncharacterized protein (DUF1800 family)
MANVSRRHFLKEAVHTTLTAGDKTLSIPYNDPSNTVLPRNLAKTSTGINPYAGVFGEQELFHLLRRTMFGATKADMDFFAGQTMEQVVDALMTVPATQPPPPLNNYSNNPNTPDADVAFGQTWVNADPNPNIEFLRINSLKAWWTSLMLNQERNVREKMTLFWHNHFSTESIVVQDSRYLYKHHALLRASCLGNFKDFVREITVDPAMLTYLNGEQNSKAAPDENYGRELQELFTVGKDLPNHYTEDDVKAAAKVLTGWRNNRLGIASFFDSNRHETSNKQFSSFYNNTVITGRTGATAGTDELNDMLNMIFAQEEVSKYICRKLYRYFVYYIIDETVETNVIVPLAEYFRDNNYDIKPVVTKLLKSEHFFDPLNRACMIKQPADQLIGSSRMMGMVFPTAANLEQQYDHWTFMQQFGILCGQDIGDPPNVAGWHAFYEDPQFYELWINSDTLPKRNLFNDIMLYAGYKRSGFTLIYDTIQFAGQFANPQDPNALINAISSYFHPIPLSQTSKDTLKIAYLLTGQLTDSYWTDAWNAHKTNPADMMAKKAVTDRLMALLKHMFGLAEYQLC